MRAFFALTLCLAGCGSTSEPVVSEPPTSEEPKPPAAPPSSTAPPAPTSPADPPPATDATKYDLDGPGTYATSSPNIDGKGFSVSLFVPNGAGPFPLVSLSPGLLQPAEAYVPFAKRLASYGIAVVMRDDPGPFTSTPTVVADIAHVVTTWLPKSAIGSKIDPKRIGLAGHSRGGKASLLAAEGALKGKVVSWFGLDPVDSEVLSDKQKARDELGQVGIPIAMLGAEVASSCSPAADSYNALWAKAVSPAVLITGKNAGHTQLEDPASCAQCNLCTPKGTADTNVVLAYAVRYVTAFFARELLGDKSVGASFEGAGAKSDIANARIDLTTK